MSMVAQAERCIASARAGWWRPATPDRRRVGVRDRRLLGELLHQQLWCWGRDVLPGPAGPPANLLLRYGLDRHRPADGGSSRYSGVLADGSAVHLWAFGICVQDGRGGMFLHRYHRGPRVVSAGWAAARATGRPADVPVFPRPVSAADRAATARRLVVFLRWAAGYERWVGRTVGVGYRRRTLARWEHPAAAADGTAAAWSALADAYGRASPFVASPIIGRELGRWRH